MDVQPLGGVGRAVAGVEPGLEGAGQLGQPLPVVVEHRADRRLDEPLDIVVVGQQDAHEAEFAGRGGPADRAQRGHRVQAAQRLLVAVEDRGRIADRPGRADRHREAEQRGELLGDRAGGPARVAAGQQQHRPAVVDAFEAAHPVGVQPGPGRGPALGLALGPGDHQDVRGGQVDAEPAGPDVELAGRALRTAQQFVEQFVADVADRGGRALALQQQGDGDGLGDALAELRGEVRAAAGRSGEQGAQIGGAGPDRGRPEGSGQSDRAAGRVGVDGGGDHGRPVEFGQFAGRGQDGAVARVHPQAEVEPAAGVADQGVRVAAGERQVDQGAVGLGEFTGRVGGAGRGCGGGSPGGALQQPGLLDRHPGEVAERGHQRDLVGGEVAHGAFGDVQGAERAGAVAERDGHHGAQPLGADRPVDRRAAPDPLVHQEVRGPERSRVGRYASAQAEAVGDGQADPQRAARAVGGADPGRAGGAVAAGRFGGGEAGDVGAQQQPGPAGDHPQQAVQFVGQGQVAGGVGERGQSGLAAAPLLGPGADGQAELLDPADRLPLRGGLAAPPGLLDQFRQLGGRSLAGQQFQDVERD